MEIRWRKSTEGQCLRIIAGRLKGRRLAPVRDPSIRPTSDRVRESFFAILREAVLNSRFLDLCAGTGSVGIEAYSRGAREVVFVESGALNTLRENLTRCKITQDVRILSMPASRALTRLAEDSKVFDIIFMDPPYDSPVLEQSLDFCSRSSLLAEDGCIVVEHRQTQVLPKQFGQLSQVRCEIYGDTALSFYVWDDDPQIR